MSNIIRAIFNNINDKEVFAKARYQYDYGMVLRFEGAVTLPSAYEVHFALARHGEAITQIGNSEGVSVPDALFLAGKTIYAWAYLHSGEDDGYTEYMVQIPVIKRAQPSDEVPTPVQQSAIDQAIAALGVAVEQTAADVETTTANAESAQASEEAAAASAAEAAETAENVEENVTAARAAKAAAEAARDRAVQAETSAGQSKTAAATSETNAAASASAAATSATNAASSASDANTSASTATSAKDTAVSKASEATTAASTATTKASEASASATAAAGSATTASTKASEAAASATTASTAASTATTKAGEAATSATNAAASAQSVASSAAQITQNAEDIDALKEDLTQMTDEVGPPIYDLTEISLTTTSGYAVTGTIGQTINISQSANWKYAKFSCEGGDSFIVNTYMASNTAVTGYVYFTDSNDKILSVQVTPTGTQQYSGNTVVTAPSGSAYIYLKGYVYGSTASHAYNYTIKPLSNEIQKNTKWLVGYEFFISPNGVSFSGNNNQNDPLIVNFNGRLYYRNLGSSGDLTNSITTSSAFSIAHGQALVFDLTTNSLSVVNNANGILNSNYRVLLKKHVTTIGGYFAYEYYVSIINAQINSSATGFITKFNNVTIMSRQGEFLINGTLNAAPFNGRIGIKSASQNGYSAVRISVRATSDHVWVLSHDSTINSVARNSDGTEIEGNVYVADSTLSELNQYDYGIKYGSAYAGEEITTLDEALLIARKLSLFLCIEIYPTTAISNDDITSLCKSVVDSGSVKCTEFRCPNIDTLQAIKAVIDGANFNVAFYSSDGDSGLQNKITALKALSNGRNMIRMTTIPETVSSASFQTSIQRVIKEGIEIELASTYGYAELKAAIEAGYCNIIESTNVVNPYMRLYTDFG